METVIFGFDRRVTSDAKFLAALARVAVDFDETPSDFVCVLAPLVGDIQWFTFRASRWANDDSLASGFFEDVMQPALDFVTFKRGADTIDEIAESRVGGKLALIVRYRGFQVEVFGTLPPEVPRRGDPAIVIFTALGWRTTLPWDGFDPSCRRVALRKAGKPVNKPVIEQGGAALPPITVVARYGDSTATPTEKFEQFPYRNIDAASVPDFTNETVIHGAIRALPGANVGVVDLNELREIRSGSIDMRGAKALVAPKLENASFMAIESCERVELPVLRTLGNGNFCVAESMSTLELPALVAVNELTIELTFERPFTVRLPKLVRGRVKLFTMATRGDFDRESVLEIPKLARSKITWDGDGPEPKALAKLLSGTAGRADRTRSRTPRPARASSRTGRKRSRGAS